MMSLTESAENVAKTTISKAVLALKSSADAGSNTASMSANHRQAPGKVARDSDIRCLAPPPT